MLEASIGMGTRVFLILKGFSPSHRIFHPSTEISHCTRSVTVRNCSTGKSSSLQPPDLPRLAQTARISLTPDEVEEFAPKIGQVIDWFGQLQAVDLDNVDPSIRADTKDDNLREDVPETFENREAIVASIPVYEDQYLKVPKWWDNLMPTETLHRRQAARLGSWKIEEKHRAVDARLMMTTKSEP